MPGINSKQKSTMVLSSRSLSLEEEADTNDAANRFISIRVLATDENSPRPCGGRASRLDAGLAWRVLARSLLS